MTDKEWTLLTMASQQHIPGACSGINAICRADRIDAAVATTASVSSSTGSSSGRPAALRVNSHELVVHEPNR